MGATAVTTKATTRTKTRVTTATGNDGDGNDHLFGKTGPMSTDMGA